jgi:hypothetical protein
VRVGSVEASQFPVAPASVPVLFFCTKAQSEKNFVTRSLSRAALSFGRGKKKQRPLILLPRPLADWSAGANWERPEGGFAQAKPLPG